MNGLQPNIMQSEEVMCSCEHEGSNHFDIVDETYMCGATDQIIKISK